MLSRVADNLYWMSRYLERAEHTARIDGRASEPHAGTGTGCRKTGVGGAVLAAAWAQAAEAAEGRCCSPPRKLRAGPDDVRPSPPRVRMRGRSANRSARKCGSN